MHLQTHISGQVANTLFGPKQAKRTNDPDHNVALVQSRTVAVNNFSTKQSTLTQIGDGYLR